MNIKKHMDKSEIASLYYDCIFSFCNQRLPDRQAAEDVTQEVFLALTEQNSIKNPDAVLKWLYTVARNKVNDYYRKHYKKPPPVSLDDVGDIPEITFDFTELYSDTELKECENTVLNQLSEQERKLYHEIYQEGSSYASLAEKYNISDSALRTRVSRLRYKIKRLIKGCLYSVLPFLMFFSYLKIFFD